MEKPSRISQKQSRLLGRLSTLPSLRDFYLAGGTAVGWRFGHRKSLDLDLFSTRKVSSLGKVVAELTDLGGRLVGESDVSVTVDVAGVPVDVVLYPYAPLEAPKPGPGTFRIASDVDLAVMKIGAISRRGLRRDFWDLHVVLTEGRMSLTAALASYAKRYSSSAADRYHLTRALAFFEDAERDDPRLIGLSARKWNAIKRYFIDGAQRLLGID